MNTNRDGAIPATYRSVAQGRDVLLAHGISARLFRTRRACASIAACYSDFGDERLLTTTRDEQS
jgi:hypothetical protein